MRPEAPPAWMSLPASSSMCTRVMPTRRVLAVLQLHVQVPADAQRQVVLRDLVGLGQIGIEVVLAVEDGALRDPAVERQSDARGVLHRLLVGHRQHARVPQADRADLRVGRLAEGDLTAAEHLGAGVQLHVDLEADDRFPAALHRAAVFRGAGALPSEPALIAPSPGAGARPAAAPRRPQPPAPRRRPRPAVPARRSAAR